MFIKTKTPQLWRGCGAAEKGMANPSSRLHLFSISDFVLLAVDHTLALSAHLDPVHFVPWPLLSWTGL